MSTPPFPIPGSPSSGGGGVSIKRQQVGSNVLVTSVPSNTYTQLLWAPSGTQDDLLDFTDPFNPFVKVAGLYMVSITVQCVGSHPGNSACYILELDQVNEDAFVTCFIQLGFDAGVGGGQGVTANMSIAYPIPLGGIITLTAQHEIGSPVDFRIAEPSAVVCIS